MDKLFKSTVEILCVQSNAVHLSSRWGFVRVSIMLLYTFRPAGAALKSFSTSFFNRLNRTKYKGYRKNIGFPSGAIRTGQLKKTLTGHTSWVTDISFSADGKTLSSLSFDGTVLLWDLTPILETLDVAE